MSESFDPLYSKGEKNRARKAFLTADTLASNSTNSTGVTNVINEALFYFSVPDMTVWQ